MTMYGQNKGHFKLENNEYIGTGARATLHKIKTVIFYLGYDVVWRVFRNKMRLYDVTITYIY